MDEPPRRLVNLYANVHDPDHLFGVYDRETSELVLEKGYAFEDWKILELKKIAHTTQYIHVIIPFIWQDTHTEKRTCPL